jgi:hypothetical protein
MEKQRDSWSEISRLIGKEKQAALDEFRCLGFDLAAAPSVPPAHRPLGLAVHPPAFLAAAALVLLAVGLTLFFWLQGSWRTTPVDRGAGGLLADSFLYGHRREPRARTPEPRAMPSFFPSFSSWGEAAGLNRAATPAVKAARPSLPVEHGDPAAVQRRMKKVIQENSIERLLTQFCQICKEV